MQVSVEIVRRLRVALSPFGFTLPDGVSAVRARHSAAERNNGAWSWFLDLPRDLVGPRGNVSCIGSQWPMQDLVRCDQWSLTLDAHGSMHVDPCTSCLRKGKRR